MDGIVDSGRTMNTLFKHLEQFKQKSINVCIMFLKQNVFDKHKEKHFSLPEDGIKYVGMSIRDEFIVGYGLDYNEEGRHY